MVKHEPFPSSIRRRMILIADDEIINREILGEILREDYDLIFAGDGAETMEKIRSNAEQLSLVLLDVLMPHMSGLEVLSAVRADQLLSRIPVIVTTSERSTEIESLKLGAIDFIPKPYPDIGVIRARVQHAIELSEDRDIIRSTERDTLTGLYNRDYFYRYARQMDRMDPEAEMDAVMVDVNHFRMVNERYGRAYGDQVLKRLGARLGALAEASGGLACRSEADAYLLYLPHREDYRSAIGEVSEGLVEEDAGENRVRLRVGVYSRADRSIVIERRFDRAKMAADTVKGSFTRTIGFYDDQLHERQLFAEKLIEDFPAALAEHQFKVYYQPKFDVRPDTPVLASAEALVRWVHPELGMVSPGLFIPLFEDNGLIQKLDQYVWREAARQIREWKDRLSYAVPVSVNVSRIDMYDPKLPEILKEILAEHGLSGQDLLLELTESAYTRDSRQIVESAEKLRNMGFRIEMDDFGTGYSSLNMLSNLPIDALKLDMQFIRSAFAEGGNTHMLEVIIGISDFLNIPAIAEGVETEEQLHALKLLGCDMVQGYFFSKPVPAAEFEPFILQRQEADIAAAEKKAAEEKAYREWQRREKLSMIMEQARADHREAEGKAGSQPEQELRPAAADHALPESEKTREHTGIQLRTASIFFVVVALIAAAALMLADVAVTRGYQRMERASDRYIAAQLAATDMETGSDYLTDRVRCFVVTGQIDYLTDFFEEVEVTRRRDLAVENLESLMGGSDGGALASLNAALDLSNELIGVENHAMRLMLETGDYDLTVVPDEIKSVALSPSELALSPQEQKERAQTLVFDNNYMHYKDRIREHVSLCTQALIRASSQELEQSTAQLALLVNLQTALTIMFLMIVLAIVLIITQMIRKPLTNMVSHMQDQEMIRPTGVEELRFVTRIYNKILKENREAREKLSHEASHDPLTGLFNRGAYDLLLESADTEHIALILIDVDNFKGVNDTYGHAVGDRVLKRVAEILRHSFRSVDILCRIGGDEFAVVMTRVNSSLRQVVLNKIHQANELLLHPKDDLPPVSLSVGVAFSDRKNPQGDIYKDADTALYRVKEAGRNGCAIY